MTYPYNWQIDEKEPDTAFEGEHRSYDSDHITLVGDHFHMEFSCPCPDGNSPFDVQVPCWVFEKLLKQRHVVFPQKKQNK
jgi:hypothetical protein